MKLDSNTDFRTYDGRVIKLGDFTHQHLCNSFYYHKYVLDDMFKDDDITRAFKEELEKRFNGELLPYRPVAKFTEEIRILKQKGYLQRKLGENGYDVIVDGEWIGEVYDN